MNNSMNANLQELFLGERASMDGPLVPLVVIFGLVRGHGIQVAFMIFDIFRGVLDLQDNAFYQNGNKSEHMLKEKNSNQVMFVRRVGITIVVLVTHGTQETFELHPGSSNLLRIDRLTRKSPNRPDSIHQAHRLTQEEPASFFLEEGEEGNSDVHEEVPHLSHLELVLPQTLDFPLDLHGSTTPTP